MTETGTRIADEAISATLLADQRSGLALLYQQYASRLYGYSLTVTQSQVLAEDAVQDSLLIAAEAIDRLKDPKRLRSWLFAITRNECLRQLRHQGRHAAMVPEQAEEVDMDAGIDAAAAGETVHAVMPAMNPADREVLAMALANDLDPQDTADALGVSLRNLHARYSRAKRAFGECMKARALYDNPAQCPELARLLSDRRSFEPLARKRIMKHVRGCAACDQRARVAYAKSGQALAAPLDIEPPASLGESLFESAADHRRVSDLVERAGPFDEDGFPSSEAPMWPRRLGLLLVLMALFTGMLAITAVGSIADQSLVSLQDRSPGRTGDVRPSATWSGPVPGDLSGKPSADQSKPTGADSQALGANQAPSTGDVAAASAVGGSRVPSGSAEPRSASTGGEVSSGQSSESVSPPSSTQTDTRPGAQPGSEQKPQPGLRPSQPAPRPGESKIPATRPSSAPAPDSAAPEPATSGPVSTRPAPDPTRPAPTPTPSASAPTSTARPTESVSEPMRPPGPSQSAPAPPASTRTASRGPASTPAPPTTAPPTPTAEPTRLPSRGL